MQTIIVDRQGNSWDVDKLQIVDIYQDDHYLYIAPSETTERIICDLLNAAAAIDYHGIDRSGILPPIGAMLDAPTPVSDACKSAMGRTYKAYELMQSLNIHLADNHRQSI